MQKESFIKCLSGNAINSNSKLQGEVIVSNINNFYTESSKAHLSIKVVLSGTEHYNINGQNFAVSQNEFLLVNQDVNIAMRIGKNNAKGICLFPSEKELSDIYTTTTSKTLSLLDDPCHKEESPMFTEKRYRFKDNGTGVFLINTIPHIYKALDSEYSFDTNLFYTRLGEHLILDQLKVNEILNGLSSSKKSTKEELYRRVDIAKNYIEANYTNRINLEEVANAAYLSKYHFTRSFKALYKISPIQYLLQLRLNKAAELLQQEYSYKEVAFMVGFSDVKNLRKALKRRIAA